MIAFKNCIKCVLKVLVVHHVQISARFVLQNFWTNLTDELLFLALMRLLVAFLKLSTFCRDPIVSEGGQRFSLHFFLTRFSIAVVLFDGFWYPYNLDWLPLERIWLHWKTAVIDVGIYVTLEILLVERWILGHNLSLFLWVVNIAHVTNNWIALRLGHLLGHQLRHLLRHQLRHLLWLGQRQALYGLVQI